MRTDDEPSPEATRRALRDVVGRSLYGVDVNPMAVEPLRVTVWMESLEPGRPLSFLDAHIKCGNSDCELQALCKHRSSAAMSPCSA